MQRYALQAIARQWLCDPELGKEDPWHRLAGCHRWLRRREDGDARVDVQHASGLQAAYYNGLQTCGSATACPRCAGQIWDHRRHELRQALETHRGRGGAVLFITLTASHEYLPLGLFLQALLRAMRRLYAGKRFQMFKKRLRYLGAVRGIEITWSPRHGWHPHFHLLWLCEELTPAQLAEVRAYVVSAWLAALQAEGLSASTHHGAVVKDSSWSIEEYLTKVGHERGWDLDAEMTMGQRKRGQARGLSPQDLLRIGQGEYQGPWRVAEERAAALYREYAAATKGLHSLRWSAGLRELLGLAAELSDDDVAAGAANTVQLQTLTTLEPRQWRLVVANDARGELLATAAGGNVVDVADFLEALGVEWPPGTHPVERYMRDLAEASP